MQKLVSIFVCAAALLACPAMCRAQVQLTEAQAKQAAISRPLPEYPEMARQLKITGRVELSITIDSEGKVADVRIVSGNPVLTKPCARIASEWKFRPILQDGKPARAAAPLTFEFR